MPFLSSPRKRGRISPATYVDRLARASGAMDPPFRGDDRWGWDGMGWLRSTLRHSGLEPLHVRHEAPRDELDEIEAETRVLVVELLDLGLADRHQVAIGLGDDGARARPRRREH